MEVQSENKCPNPNCDAGMNDIDWGITEVCEGFNVQGATCKKCGTEFTEEYQQVYRCTIYELVE